MEVQLTRDDIELDDEYQKEEALAPLSAHLASDTSSILDALLRSHQQDEFDSHRLNSASGECDSTKRGESSVIAIERTEKDHHSQAVTDSRLLKQDEFGAFDCKIVQSLEENFVRIATPGSLRQFHERISQVLESWNDPGDFINQSKQLWPAVVAAKLAYEQELKANFARYGRNTSRLLSMQTTLTEPILRTLAIERIVAEEVERACNTCNPNSPDFPLSQKFQAWQAAIKDFAIRALGPQ